MLNEAKRNRYLAELGISYREYLASPHWKKVKAEFWRSGMKKACAFCGSKRFDLHHVTYNRIGKELPTDLLPLCHVHHRMVHEESPDLDWDVVKVLRTQGGKIKKKKKKRKQVRIEPTESKHARRIRLGLPLPSRPGDGRVLTHSGPLEPLPRLIQKDVPASPLAARLGKRHP